MPASKIIETAKAEGADIIGLSGLITPSLDEMSFLAGEMERQGMNMPLLMARDDEPRPYRVKIDPELQGRAGGPRQRRQPRRRRGIVAALTWRREAIAPTSAPNTPRSPRHISAPRPTKTAPAGGRGANAVKADFAKTPPRNHSLGIKSFDAYDLAELAEYIDWTPFFQTWELTGRFPAISTIPRSAKSPFAL